MRSSPPDTPSFRGVLAVLAVAFCVLAVPARAYDGDTHYAWTYYLAVHVGYTPRQAFQIASAAWAIDHDAQTGPLHATKMDTVSGAPNPVIERVWRRYHAFADAVYVRGTTDVDAVAERRREGEAALAAIGARQRNLGAQIHYAQDYFAHNEYDSVRGHAIWGHAPDRIGHRPMRARAMTRKTIAMLTEFAPSVGVKPRAPDEARLWDVLDRLSAANPPLLLVDPANYDLVWDALADLDFSSGVALVSGLIPSETLQEAITRLGVPVTIRQTLGLQKIAWGDVDLGAAVDIVNAALIEDAEVARVPRYPADWVLPKAWIQFDYDADGVATAADRFAVEQLKVTFGKANVAFRRDPSSAALYEVTAGHEYTIEGMAALPAFRALPVVERSTWSDDAEQIRLDRDRTNGGFVIERKVLRPRAALLDGSLTWTPAVELFGEVHSAPPVKIRLGDDAQWYVIALHATGYDLRSAGGVRTDAGGAAAEQRAGQHRRRGAVDLVVVKVPRGGDVKAAIAEIRRVVAEPHCRRAASIPPSETIEPPGASLAGLPQYWDEVALEPRGPFPTRDLAAAAMKPERWEALEFVPTPNLADIEFRSGCGSPVAMPVLVNVPNVAGLRADEAEARLRAAGLGADVVAGAPSRSRDEQYTVERQEPAANARVEKGTRVRVAVRPAFVDPGRTVPAVVGMTAVAARQRLEASGFLAQIAGGDPAPSPERAFTVQDQRPDAGANAPEGSSVVVRIHSKPDTNRIVPNVVGLSAADAARRLQEVALVAVPQGGDPAPTRDAAFMVQSQRPAAGATVDAGAAVEVRIHSAFTPAQPWDREVRETGDERPSIPPGADPNFFRCPSFGVPVEPAALTRDRRSVACPGNRFLFYRLGQRRFHLIAAWNPEAIWNSSWVAKCGGPPVSEWRPARVNEIHTRNAETGEPVTWKIPQPAEVVVVYPSARNAAIVTLSMDAHENMPVPETVQEVVRQVMAETEWRAGRCDGTGPPPARPDSPAPAPPPVRQAPIAQPPAPPADNRPLCTCRDAAGRPYRMLFGQDCDPGSLSRDDNCRP